VVFIKDTTIVRATNAATASVPTGTWTVTVPIANYGTSPNDAILFGGSGTGPYTLLGIGVITATSGGTNSGANSLIEADTTGVTFTVAPIVTSVDSTRAGSDFKITGPSTPDNYATLEPTTESGAAYTGVPVFRVPAGSSAITASWTVANTHLAKAQLGTTGTWATSTAVDTGVTLAFSNFSPPTLTTTATFTFNITSTTAGLTKLVMAVPVYALNNSPGNYNGSNVPATAWVLSGGADGTAYDTGSNNGGAILIKVGDAFGATITINPPTWP
jgi:hypothetical protein